MHQFFLVIGSLLILLMLPVLYRAVKGPTSIDRLIGVNIIGAKTTVLLLTIGVIYDRVDMFVDLALTYALLNFISALAASRFLFYRGLVGRPNPFDASSNGKEK